MMGIGDVIILLKLSECSIMNIQHLSPKIHTGFFKSIYEIGWKGEQKEDLYFLKNSECLVYL